MEIIHNADRNINKVALTFDDGPNPFWTTKVLDLLDQYSIKANFFVLGKWVEEYPEIVKEISRRGHLIGNHSYSHAKGVGDFERAEDSIFKIGGLHTKFIRPPYLDKHICRDYKPAVSEEVKIIGGDGLNDWRAVSVEEILAVAREKINNGSIIILHDGANKEEQREDRPKMMFESLPQIIEIIGKKGLEIVRLDQLNY
jgi:peptidoglycan/xylan/chitin deacetylase (PgdA/CDA1 family)